VIDKESVIKEKETDEEYDYGNSLPKPEQSIQNDL